MTLKMRDFFLYFVKAVLPRKGLCFPFTQKSNTKKFPREKNVGREDLKIKFSDSQKTKNSKKEEVNLKKFQLP